MAIGGGPAASAAEPDVSSFLSRVSPADLVPGTDRFGAAQPAPAVVPVFRGGTLAGHVYLNSQYIDSNGYSGRPIHILVGLDLDGTITGVRLVDHHEPIVLIGIPESKVVAYLNAFVGYNPLRASAANQGPPRPDIVSGATVTVLVMGESVARSALRVARTLRDRAASAGVAASGASTAEPAAAPARSMITGAGPPLSWQALLAQGAVRHLRLTVGEVNRAFERSGNAEAARRAEPGAADTPFIDLYVALVSQPTIGASLLGAEEAGHVERMLGAGRHAILVAGDGLYSFKGSGYVRGGIFDRIELIQAGETVRFHDRDHRRIGSLQAMGAPSLRDIGVFALPSASEFDPLAPWRLQLLVQRSTGALDKAFVSFELPYELPAAYVKGPAAAPEATRAAEADAVTPLWQRIWASRIAAIVMLGLMLAVLTAIFFFQEALLEHERLFERLRLGFLVLTLVWLGWIVQAQLSVVNVLTFTSALRTGFQWSSFLVDPLIFILWCAVAVALLFWGRGVFCGWLCPFGALQELSNRIARALKLRQFKVPWRVHERAVALKYVIFLGLFGVSLGSLAMAERLAEVEPFKTAIVLRFVREWWFVAFAVALLVAGLFVERFFCRYLCPLGAALAIPGRLRMFDWLKRYRECGNPCMRCYQECPVQAIHPEGHINPNECISCLHCQMLYHHDHKCPVRIQRRLKRERREAMAGTPPEAAPAPAAAPRTIPIRPAGA